MPLRMIPVLDIKGGWAVHAIGGDRAHYQPLRTRLHADSHPLGVARAYRDLFQCHELYLADLDAIAGDPPHRSLYEAIRSLGVALWVDAGIRDRSLLAPLLAAGVETLVIGLETLRGPAELAAIAAQVSASRIVFSLDLREGAPLQSRDSAWDQSDPLALARSAIAQGVRRLLLLDLARVGTGRGIGTLPLLRRLRQEFPKLELTVGGGIANGDEVRSIAATGADAVLVGSALHDGRITPRILAELLASLCAQKLSEKPSTRPEGGL